MQERGRHDRVLLSDKVICRAAKHDCFTNSYIVVAEVDVSSSILITTSAEAAISTNIVYDTSS